MRLTERRIAATLRHHSYKLTPQRRAVIRVIATTQDHLTPAGLYERVHQEQPTVGLVTIYRTLDILVKLGLICELHAGGSCHSYTMSTPERHHHLICSDCGEVIDFTGYDLTRLEQRLCRETGFEIEGHLLEFIGLCQKCRKNA